MKNITLVKSHPSVQLGHLYEHLFMRYLNEFMYEKGLFKFLDYAATGTTFEESGVIIVSVDMYNEDACRFASDIQKLSVNLGSNPKEHLVNALQQIVAEEPKTLQITDMNELVNALTVLDKQPWSNLDDITFVDTNSIRKKKPPIYLTEQPSGRQRHLYISLECDREIHNELLPVFYIICKFLLHNIVSRLSYEYGFYPERLYSKTRHTVVSDLAYKSSTIPRVDVSDIHRSVSTVIDQLLSAAVISRLAKSFSSVHYSKSCEAAPSFEEILQDTGVLIGSKGWQELATEKNIRNLIDQIIINIKCGRERTAYNLKNH